MLCRDGSTSISPSRTSDIGFLYSSHINKIQYVWKAPSEVVRRRSLCTGVSTDCGFDTKWAYLWSHNILFPAQGKFQPVDQVVMDEEFPACSRLLSCTRSLASLHHIAEEKGEFLFLTLSSVNSKLTLIALFKCCVLYSQRWDHWSSIDTVKRRQWIGWRKR